MCVMCKQTYFVLLLSYFFISHGSWSSKKYESQCSLSIDFLDISVQHLTFYLDRSILNNPQITWNLPFNMYVHCASIQTTQTHKANNYSVQCPYLNTQQTYPIKYNSRRLSATSIKDFQIYEMVSSW